jgi:hypothetical protein
MLIPHFTGPFWCLERKDLFGRDPVPEDLNDSPSLGISFKMYSGEKAEVKDRLKMLKTDRHLVLELLYEKGLEKPFRQSHVVYIRSQDTDLLYKIPVNYEGETITNLGFYPTEQSVQPKHSVTFTASSEGTKAFVLIPLEELKTDWNRFQINVFRIDWKNGPVMSLFPLRHGFFIEDEAGKVYIYLNENPKAFADIRFVDRPNEHVSELNARIETVGFNQRRLSVPKGSLDPDFSFCWETPTGERTDLCPSFEEKDDRIHISFCHPPVKEEGFYKLQSVKGSEEFLFYIDRRHLIKDYRKEEGEPKEKAKVDFSLVSEEAKALEDIVPPYGGMEDTHDPKFPELRAYGLFEYDFSSPHKIRSQKTKDEYPHPDFPEDKQYEFYTRFGKKIGYPYYLAPNGTKCFLSAALWAAQRAYLCKKLPETAKKDPAGAARVLAKLADRYPYYEPYNNYYSVKYPMALTQGPPYPYYGGFWSEWFYSDLPRIAGLVEAYAEAVKTDAFEQLSKESGKDVEKEVWSMIEEGLDFSFSYGIQNTNMDFAVWDGLIRIGKALNKPEYVHMACERIDRFIKRFYFSDGFWYEVTVSYHAAITKGLLRALSMLQGYSDPEGYRYPGSGERIDNYDFLNLYPVLKKSQELSKLFLYPDGRIVGLQDTHSSYAIERGCESEPFLFPAAKIARITNEDSQDPVQLLMYDSPKYGHHHWDALNINLYAKNAELLPDIGYTHTYNRAWTTSTLAHNTVTVNGNESDKNTFGGNFLRYCQGGKNGSAIRIEDSRCYEETKVYDREALLIPMEESSCYILDIFRVKGGSRHEYALNLCADYDTATECMPGFTGTSKTLLPEGVRYEKPKEELYKGNAQGHYHAYMHVHDVKFVRLRDEPYRILTALTEDSHKGCGLIIHGVKTDGTLYIGKAPSMRLTRQSFYLDHNDTADLYTMDKLVLRREGEDLESVFVHVIEPFDEKQVGRIVKAERLHSEGTHPFDAIVKVEGEGFTDYVFSAYREDLKACVEGIEFCGQQGFVRITEGKEAVIRCLGASVKISDKVYAESKRICGKILNVLSKARNDSVNGFEVPFMKTPDLKGQTVIVHFPDHTTFAFRIQDVYPKEDTLLLDIGDADPGFIIRDGKSFMTFYPFFCREGDVLFSVDPVFTYRAPI